MTSVRWTWSVLQGIAAARRLRIGHERPINGGTQLIVRRWEARTTTEGAERYQAHFATVVLEKLKTLDGFRGAQILRAVDPGADQVKLIDLTYWESLDSIGAFAGADLRTAVVDETAQRYLVDFDSSVSHYSLEVDTVTGSARAGT